MRKRIITALIILALAFLFGWLAARAGEPERFQCVARQMFGAGVTVEAVATRSGGDLEIMTQYLWADMGDDESMRPSVSAPPSGCASSCESDACCRKKTDEMCRKVKAGGVKADTVTITSHMDGSKTCSGDCQLKNKVAMVTCNADCCAPERTPRRDREAPRR